MVETDKELVATASSLQEEMKDFGKRYSTLLAKCSERTGREIRSKLKAFTLGEIMAGKLVDKKKVNELLEEIEKEDDGSWGWDRLANDILEATRGLRFTKDNENIFWYFTRVRKMELFSRAELSQQFQVFTYPECQFTCCQNIRLKYVLDHLVEIEENMFEITGSWTKEQRKGERKEKELGKIIHAKVLAEEDDFWFLKHLKLFFTEKEQYKTVYDRLKEEYL